MLQEAKSIKIRKAEGDYKYDNPDLEHQNSWQKKCENLETKYDGKEMPKIAFHKLNDEGNLKFMQIKRDKVMTTLGWSLIGNVAGVGVVRYIEKNNEKYNNLKHIKKREMLKVLGFFGTVSLFTLYGYGAARQHFVREKIKIVEEHSIDFSGK